MKIRVFLATALAAFVFTACSKNENENLNHGSEKEKALLNVRIATPTRATAPTTGFGQSGAAADEVKNFKVFILDQNDDIEWTDYSPTGGPLNNISVTTDAKYVLVVANAGDIAISSKSELDAYRADLNGTGSQLTDRWSSGKSSELVFTQNGTEFVANAEVQLTFIAARIMLTIENGMTGYDATKTDGSLVLNNVVVLNARATSKLHDPVSLLATPAKYYSGIAVNSLFTNWPHHTDVEVVGIMKDDIVANDFSTTYYYYVFANDAITAETFPTIVTLTGTFRDKAVYYPVHLTPYEGWAERNGEVSGIVPGKSYEIVINLKVDPTFEGGDADGTDDPTQPLVNAKINVTIKTATWDPVTLRKEF